MSQDGSTSPEMAESASVGQAGEPQRLDDLRADQAEGGVAGDGTPTPEELDARNARFSGPRKPMGPVDQGTPETVPDEA
jgi:hypothetical protein